MEKLDAEHERWRQDINPIFHMFTIGLALFEQPEHFQRALNSWNEGFVVIGKRPDYVTVQNPTRFSFNSVSIFNDAADFSLKEGDVAKARGVWLGTVPRLHHYAEWGIGRDAYEHRLAHSEEIAALYRNNDPSDDPLPFNMKRRKWGYNTMTCQTCHQAQRKVWREEEKKHIMLPPEDVATLKVWPEFSTTWYGAIKRAD